MSRGRDSTSRERLSDRDRLFVAAYLRDLDMTAAARAAGYKDGASINHAGSRVARKPAVKAAIDAALAERRQRYAVEAERALRELAAIAFSDVRDVLAFGPDGVTLRDGAALSREQAAAISEVSETSSETGSGARRTVRRRVRVKLHAKLQALELLGRHLGLWTSVNANLARANLTAISDDQLRARAQELLAAALGGAAQAGAGGAVPDPGGAGGAAEPDHIAPLPPLSEAG